MLRDCLTREHYQVTCAAGGREVCRLFDRTPFHLALPGAV